jgi:hypothetical protein
MNTLPSPSANNPSATSDAENSTTTKVETAYQSVPIGFDPSEVSLYGVKSTASTVQSSALSVEHGSILPGRRFVVVACAIVLCAWMMIAIWDRYARHAIVQEYGARASRQNSPIAAEPLPNVDDGNPAHDPHIVGLARQLNARDIDRLGLIRVSSPEDLTIARSALSPIHYGRLTVVGTFSPYSSTIGTPDGTIELVQTDTASMRSAFAHEYLHHLWANRLTTADQERISRVLSEVYEHDTKMHKIMQSYGSARDTELFAYYCANTSDTYLSDELLDICGAYIDRRVLAGSFER